MEKARKTGRKELTVRRLAATPTMDLARDHWMDTAWTTLDSRASAAVAIAGNTLYAAWHTGDPNAIAGGPGDFAYQFKHGGALDLMIGSSDPAADRSRHEPVMGDQRLLVTQIQGKTRAILYRAVAPGAPASEAVLFGSPIGQVHFDQVTDVTDRVKLSTQNGDFELAAPLAVLGLSTLKEGRQVLGDIGLLRGDGAQTTQRVYWNNQDTGMVSDVPSEARLRPANWGLWRFE